MNNNNNPDIGGGRGYSLSFASDHSYASVQNYFTPSTLWPVKEMTMQVWIRWTSVKPGGTGSFFATVMAANDPDHVQLGLNVVQTSNSKIPNLELFIAKAVTFTPINHINLYSTWTHVCMTYNSTDISLYFNGTLASKVPSSGNKLRWADTTAFFLGGWVEQQGNDPLLVSATLTDHFYGSMDDLAFYNRVLSVGEIAKNWQQAVDTSDAALFLYYNFDEGPGSTIIKNHGTIGTQGDLYNGQILGSTTYFETTSEAEFPVQEALFSPGVPVIDASSSLPVVFAVDAGASVRLHIACQLTATTTTAASLIPSQAQFVTLPSGIGKIYQADSSQTRITTANTVLTNAVAEFWYSASTTTSGSTRVDSMRYSCICNGITQTGTINVIINPAVVPDPTISIVAVSGATTKFNLHGSLSHPGLMQVNITSLPTLGRLSQWNFEQPNLVSFIVKPGTQVTNIINGIQYIPTEGLTGMDAFSYQLIHNGMISTTASVQISVQSWDNPPVIPLSGTTNPIMIVNRQATSLNLPVKDELQKQYLGVYIMSLPTKGTLYQRNPDGSLGTVIDKPFQYSFPTPSRQYATKVLNISSIYGTGQHWDAQQMLGPPNCFLYGGCIYATAFSTLKGTGGFNKGCSQGICFASNPDENYKSYGYTEYIEVGFNTSVLVTQLINGEPSAMGSVKNILAKDPLGNWMTLWSTPTVDAAIEKFYYKFQKYRNNTPDICQTPFFTNHIRYEIDTRDVPNWSEFDYFELYGLSVVDVSMVNWYGNSKWDVIYVPHKDASGLDSFTYSATDCPGILRVGFAQRWSPNVGTINVNIIPVGTAGTVKIDPFKGVTKLDLSIWSVNTTFSTADITSFSHTNVQPLTFVIAALPLSSSGLLKDNKGASILTAPYSLNDSHVWFNPVPCCTATTCTQAQIQQQQQTNNHTSFSYLSSDIHSKGSLTVSLAIVCPHVTINANATSTDVGIPIAIALAVVIFVAGMVYGLRQYVLKREAIRQQKRLERERLEAAAKHAMQQLEEAAKRAEEETKKAEGEQERERQLRHELQENIVNSAHDIKSPTTALGLAVESLIYALDNKKPLSEAKRQRILGTLHDMEHTITALTMIINRSVDASISTTSGSARGLNPNNVPLDLEKVMNEVVAFAKWQADCSSIEVVMDPLPADVPDEIIMDEKWLKEDLLCLASNCVKFSRANQKVPALFRISVVPSPTKELDNLKSSSSLQFTFIDSGYPLSEERLTNLFNRPRHSERQQIGGMGLGLYCLSEHVKALQGQYGARRRMDGQEGTEIFFSFPLVLPAIDQDHFVMNETWHGLGNSSMKSNDVPLFSAPQNRRRPTLRALSQKSQNSQPNMSPRENSIRIGRGDAIIDNGLDNSAHDANSFSTLVSVPFVPKEVTTTTSVKAVTDDDTDEKVLLKSRIGFDRMQEILGTLPILLVDDAPTILKMTKRSIQNECSNVSFMEAKNGEEAFKRVVEAYASFELIITDIQMPICNGLDFTRKVRQFEQEKGLSPKIIIGISANDQQKIAEEANTSGMDGFMHKPFKLATLMHVIEDISSRRKQMQFVINAVVVGEQKDKDIDFKNSMLLEQEGDIKTVDTSDNIDSKSDRDTSTISGRKILLPLTHHGNGKFRGKKQSSSNIKVYVEQDE